MARALRAWAINRGGKNSVRNLRYGPRTRLVRGIDEQYQVQQSKQDYLRYVVITIRQLNTKLSISSMHFS